MAAFTALFDKVEIRTAATGSVVIDMLTPSNPATRELYQKLKPAVILTGRGGRVEIAPAGLPPAHVSDEFVSAGAEIGLAGLAAIVGVGLIAYSMGRRAK